MPSEAPAAIVGGSRALLTLYEVSKIPPSASQDLDATVRQVLGLGANIPFVMKRPAATWRTKLSSGHS